MQKVLIIVACVFIVIAFIGAYALIKTAGNADRKLERIEALRNGGA